MPVLLNASETRQLSASQPMITAETHDSYDSVGKLWLVLAPRDVEKRKKEKKRLRLLTSTQ